MYGSIHVAFLNLNLFVIKYDNVFPLTFLRCIAFCVKLVSCDKFMSAEKNFASLLLLQVLPISVFLFVSLFKHHKGCLSVLV